MWCAALIWNTLWLAGTPTARAQPSPPSRGGISASISGPGEADAAIGYDLQAAARGRRFELDLDLCRAVLPYGHDPTRAGWMRLDARRTAGLAAGVLLEAAGGSMHHLKLRLDRMSWLDLAQGERWDAWDHHVSHSAGIAGLYGWRSPRDRRVRTALELGGGLRRARRLETSHDGHLFDWDRPPRRPAATPEAATSLVADPSTAVEDRLPTIDPGQHRTERESGVALSGALRVDVALWPGRVDGRLHSSLALDQMSVAATAWGTAPARSRTRWTAITGQTRLAARFVAVERLVVPSLFVDLHTMQVLEAGGGLAVVPVYGVGVTRGVL